VSHAAARLVYLVNDEDQMGGTDPVDVSGGPNSAYITQAVERPQIERPQARLCNITWVKCISTNFLCACHFFAAMFTHLSPLLDDFGAKRAFTGKVLGMNFCDGRINCLLNQFIAESGVS
jgi:hypothetical protein